MKRLLFGAIAIALATSPAIVAATPGDPDPDFGTGGVVTGGLLDKFGPVTVDSAGRTVVVGVKLDTADTGHVAIVRYLADGSPDPSFSGDGRSDLAITAVLSTFSALDVRVLASGSIVTAGYRTTVAGDPFSNGMWAAKVMSNGTPDAAYSGDGISVLDQGFTVFQPDGSVAADGSIHLFQGGLGGGSPHRVGPNGSFADVTRVEDTTVLGAGCVFMGPPSNAGAASLSATTFVHATNWFVGDSGGCPVDGAGVLLVTAQTAAGAELWTRAILEPDTADDSISNSLNAVTVIDGDVFVATGNGATRYIHRYDGTTGAHVTGWGTGGRASLAAGFGTIGALAGLPGGKIAVVGGRSNPPVSSVKVDRLLSNGSTDTTFPRRTIALGGAVGFTDVAGAPDGDVVVTTQRDGQGTVRHLIGNDATSGGDGGLETIEPGRLLETRKGVGFDTIDGQFEGAGQRPAGSITKVKIAGRGGVPNGATTAMLNLVAVRPIGPGFLTIYPCTPDVPLAATLNYGPGTVVANAVYAKLNNNGEICIYTKAASDLVIDVNGYVPDSSDLGNVDPARLLETRKGVGFDTIDGQFEGAGQRPAGSITKVKIAGRGGVPNGATTAMLNLVAVRPTGPGFLTIYPCTPDVPLAATLNYGPGTVVANAVYAKLNNNGEICIYTKAASDLVIDVNGYVPDSSDLGNVDPARLLETRKGVGFDTIDGQFEGAGQRPAGSITKVKIAGRGGVPNGATTAMLNLVAVRPTGPGFLTIYPCTPDVPLAATLNYGPGTVVANAVYAKLNNNGEICIYTKAASDLVIDVNGYVPD